MNNVFISQKIVTWQLVTDSSDTSLHDHDLLPLQHLFHFLYSQTEAESGSQSFAHADDVMSLLSELLVAAKVVVSC